MSDSKQVVQLTEKAIEQVKHIFVSEEKGPGMGLRLGVVGGGCSGLSYNIDFDQKNEKDNVQDYGDFKVYIDLKSSIYLKDVILDFKDGLNGKGFVFSNPNASNTCGCGESFSV